MKRVIIESPFAGDVEANLTYLRRALRDSIHRGEAPFASHAIYTQPGVLDDNDPAERKLGIEAGFAWWVNADLIVFYTDRGFSKGMLAAMQRANDRAFPIEIRTLDQVPTLIEVVEGIKKHEDGRT